MRGMNRKSLAVVVLGSLSLTGVSLAMGGPERMGKRHPELMQKYDANKNGQLEDGEREAMREELKKLREEKVAKYDTNKDGKLDETERKAVRDQMAAERFKALDTNGNGSLSLEEFKAGAAEREGHHGRYRGGHR